MPHTPRPYYTTTTTADTLESHAHRTLAPGHEIIAGHITNARNSDPFWTHVGYFAIGYDGCRGGGVFARIIVGAVDEGVFYFDTADEDQAPEDVHGVPLRVLDALTPTYSERAQQWRTVARYHATH